MEAPALTVQDLDNCASGDNSTLRTLIREELCECFRSLQPEFQESLRRVLREERSDARRESKTGQPVGSHTNRDGSQRSTLPGSVADAPSVQVTNGAKTQIQKKPSLKLKGGYKAAQTFQLTSSGDVVREASRNSLGEKTKDLSDLKDDAQRIVKAHRKRPKKQHLFKVNGAEEAKTGLQRLIANKYYEYLSGTLIVLNSFLLGYQTQYLAELHRDQWLEANSTPRAGEPSSSLLFEDKSENIKDVFFVFQSIFTVIFAIELALRWKSDGLLDFFRTDVGWNVLDIIVVGSGTLELLLYLFAKATGTKKSTELQTVSVIRVLRVLRIFRVARVIRVMRFFRELRMMVYAICGCVKNLAWVILILVLTFYIFGVAFTAAADDFLDEPWMWDNEGEHGDLVVYFGTVDRSILSLFMAMSGGNDWIVYYNELQKLQDIYCYGFLFFICFSVFAVVNIITGVFVESALQANLKDKDIVVQEELEAKKVYLASMAELFEEMDEDGKGTISMAEFDEKLNDETVIAYFNALKLDVSDARTLFTLLDLDHSAEVGIDEFLEGCYRLQGESRSLDMKIMQYEMTYLQESFRAQSENIQELKFWLMGLSEEGEEASDGNESDMWVKRVVPPDAPSIS